MIRLRAGKTLRNPRGRSCSEHPFEAAKARVIGHRAAPAQFDLARGPLAPRFQGRNSLRILSRQTIANLIRC